MLHAVEFPGRFTVQSSVLKALRSPAGKKSVQLNFFFSAQDLHESGSRTENNPYAREFNTGNQIWETSFKILENLKG